MAHEILVEQPSLEGMCPITEAVERLAQDSSVDERGAIFTRPEVVAFMLDLMGYTSDQPLHKLSLLEPSFGSGEFLLAALERLLVAHKSNGGADDLIDCLRAVELHADTYTATRTRVLAVLGHRATARGYG